MLYEICQNQAPDEDYSSVFIGHAQLYVFAEKWIIPELKTLTLNKTHKTLIGITLYERRRKDIVKLLQYAYSNDNTPDTDEGADDLRALITHYITCELESFLQCPEFLRFCSKVDSSRGILC